MGRFCGDVFFFPSGVRLGLRPYSSVKLPEEQPGLFPRRPRHRILGPWCPLQAAPPHQHWLFPFSWSSPRCRLKGASWFGFVFP